MIFVFSSASKDLYKQDVLDTCCYPERHVMRFRYSERLVPEQIRCAPALLVGEKGLITFASLGNISTHPAGGSGTSARPADFVFLPIRECSVVDARMEAGILVLDLSLGLFVNYGEASAVTASGQWDAAIKSHRDRPRPSANPTEGFFVYQDHGIQYAVSPRNDDRAWKSVIERINRSELANCVTFRVVGFYRLGVMSAAARAVAARMCLWLAKRVWGLGQWRQGLARVLSSFPRSAESRVLPSITGADCIYRFPMGDTILLKLFFYHAEEQAAPTRLLRLIIDPRAATASRSEFYLRSRYDEARVLLSCARVTDPTYSALSMVQGASNTTDAQTQVWAPQPTFITLVKAPFLFLPTTVALFALGLLLLNLTAADLQPLAAAAPQAAQWMVPISKFPRIVGTLLVISASWRYLRKFPLK
jgi:hypothetical protein